MNVCHVYSIIYKVLSHETSRSEWIEKAPCRNIHYIYSILCPPPPGPYTIQHRAPLPSPLWLGSRGNISPHCTDRINFPGSRPHQWTNGHPHYILHNKYAQCWLLMLIPYNLSDILVYSRMNSTLGSNTVYLLLYGKIKLNNSEIQYLHL